MSFLCARERSRSSLRFFSSVSRAFSRLNRLLVVSSAAQCVNYRAESEYRAESLAMRTESRERGPALLTCTDEEGGTSCRRKNWGDDLFRREKPLDVRARSRPFLLARAPRRGQCMGLHAGEIPCKHRSAKTTPLPAKFGRETTFFHSSFVGKSRARWLSSRFARARPDGTAIAGAIPCNHRSYMSVA